MLGNTICECRFFGEWVGLSHYTFPIIRSSYQCSQSENSIRKLVSYLKDLKCLFQQVYIIMSPFMNKPLRDQRENVRKLSRSLLVKNQKISRCQEYFDALNVNGTPKHLLNVQKRSDAEETNF